MTTSSTKTRALCVATRCTSVEQFVATFHRFCGDDQTFFVATMTSRPIGLETPFSIQLADKQPVLRGMCIVLDAWATPENRYRRPGIRLGIKRLTADSQVVFDRLKAASRTPANVEATPPPGPAPLPSLASGSRPPSLARRSSATPPPLPPMLTPRATPSVPVPSRELGGAAPVRETPTPPPVPPPVPPPLPSLADGRRPLPSVVPAAKPALPVVTVPPLPADAKPLPVVTVPPLPAEARPAPGAPPVETPPAPIAAAATRPTPPTPVAAAATRPTPPTPVAAPPTRPTPPTPVAAAATRPTPPTPVAAPPTRPTPPTPVAAPPTRPTPPAPIAVTRFQVALHVDTIPPPVSDVEFKPQELISRRRPEPRIISEPSPDDAPVDEAQPAVIVDRRGAPVDGPLAPTGGAPPGRPPELDLPEPRDTVPMVAAEQLRTPGSAFVLPANPLQDLSDESIEGFIDCTLYEETENIFHTAEDGPEWDDATAESPASPAPGPAMVPAMPFDATPNLTVRSLGETESLAVGPDDPSLTRTASGELGGGTVTAAVDDDAPSPRSDELPSPGTVEVDDALAQTRTMSGELWSETVRKRARGGSPRTQPRPDTPLPRPASNVPLDLGEGPDPASWFDSVSLPYGAALSAPYGATLGPSAAMPAQMQSEIDPAADPATDDPSEPSMLQMAPSSDVDDPPLDETLRGRPRRAAIDAAMDRSMAAPIDYAMSPPMGPSMGAPIDPAMGPAMGPPMGAPIDYAMGPPMGPPMRALTPPVGLPMGAPLYPAVGPPMGLPMGSPVDPAMGHPMGQPMGAPVDPAMGHPMGSPMGAPIDYAMGGQPMGPAMGPPIDPAHAMGYPMPGFDHGEAGPHGAAYPPVDGAQYPRYSAADLGMHPAPRTARIAVAAWQPRLLIGATAVVAILLAFGLARLIRGRDRGPAPAPAATPTAPAVTPAPPAAAPLAGSAAPAANAAAGADETADTGEPGDTVPDDDGEAVAGGTPVVGSGPCRFTVATTPAGSIVRLDDQAMGPSPITIESSCDKHKVDISHARYQAVTKWLTLAADQPQTLDISLPRPIHAVTVTSFPPGAELSIDGHRAGTTPTVVQMTGFATVNLTFTKPGFQTVTRKVYSKVAQDRVFVKLMK